MHCLAYGFGDGKVEHLNSGNGWLIMANILVVDDEVDILMLIKNALQKDEHLVSIVSNSTEVEKMELGSYDLILLDVMMPAIDGFTLCRQIRHAVDCPILSYR